MEPSQVRLKTNDDDAYKWERTEEKEHLFSKNLSDLSIGALKELYEGVDNFLIAAWKPSKRDFQRRTKKNVRGIIYNCMIIQLT